MNNTKSNRRRSKKPTKNTPKQKGGTKGKQSIVRYMLQMLMTVKLYHWNTLSYATHKATDDLYGELNTLIDQFVETLLGKTKRERIETKTLLLKTFKDNSEFERELESYKKYMMDLGKKFNQKENSDILNIRDEILATLNKISYLLTLK
jgi:DNA-binding ferritin-like protein